MTQDFLSIITPIHVVLPDTNSPTEPVQVYSALHWACDCDTDESGKRMLNIHPITQNRCAICTAHLEDGENREVTVEDLAYAHTHQDRYVPGMALAPHLVERVLEAANQLESLKVPYLREYAGERRGCIQIKKAPGVSIPVKVYVDAHGRVNALVPTSGWLIMDEEAGKLTLQS